MQTATIEKLIRLNQVFYMTYADSFHKTRLNPWSGWNKLLSELPNSTPAHYVDIGCGNGRWFRFLSDNHIFIESAIGIDLDTYMLGQARYEFIKDDKFRFYQGDCISDIHSCLAHMGNPDVISLFGLCHHIPSSSFRIDYLKKLFSSLSLSGTLIISFWQFELSEQYQHKVINPSVVAHEIGIPESEFEPGDYFLGWQSESSVLRYCHSFSEKEIYDISQNLTQDFSLIKGNGNDASNAYGIYRRSHV